MQKSLGNGMRMEKPYENHHRIQVLVEKFGSNHCLPVADNYLKYLGLLDVSLLGSGRTCHSDVRELTLTSAIVH